MNVSGVADNLLEDVRADELNEGDDIVVPSECAVYHIEGNMVKGAGVTSFDATYHKGSRTIRMLFVDNAMLWRVKSD